jgi:hypothetical protein
MSIIHETKYLIYEVIEPGVLKATYRPKLPQIDQVAAMRIFKDRMQFQKGMMFYLILSESGDTRFSPEARLFLGTEGSEGLLAIAIVAEQDSTYVTGSFMAEEPKTGIPITIVESVEQALSWVHQLMRQPKIHGRS